MKKGRVKPSESRGIRSGQSSQLLSFMILMSPVSQAIELYERDSRDDLSIHFNARVPILVQNIRIVLTSTIKNLNNFSFHSIDLSKIILFECQSKRLLVSSLVQNFSLYKEQ